MIVTRAPLRIPLGGGGTDYVDYYRKHGGFILGFATNLYVYVVINPTKDSKYHLKYSKNEVSPYLINLDNRVAASALDFMGIRPGLEVVTFSDVHESSGLGGSSAFCSALLLALGTFKDKSVTKADLFVDSYKVERDLAGEPGGIQDQWFAAYGGAYKLELKDDIIPIPVDVTDFIQGLKLVYTGKSRKGHYSSTFHKALIDTDNPHLLTSLKETERIGRQIYKYLIDGDYLQIGELFNHHWEVKKGRDPNITTSKIDVIYSKCLEEGAIGAKLIGEGGGGYFLVYSEENLEGINSIPVGIDNEGCKVLYDDGSRQW